jgi:hypothetical protein
MVKRVRCGVTVQVRKKSDPSAIGVYDAPCKMWKCPDCRPVLEERWFSWLSYKMADLTTAYVRFVSDSNWGSVHKRIVRAGGEYVAIRQVDGLLVIFTDVPESKGEPVSVASATDMLKRFISSAYPYRPIHTSGGWAIKSSPIKKSDWERIQELPMSVPEAAEQLTILGVDVQWYFGYVIHGFSAVLPDNMDLFVVQGKLQLVPCIVPRTSTRGTS